MKRIIAVSGPIGVGKSSFFVEFMRRNGGTRISTRELILAEKHVPNERGALQRAGDELDVQTKGAWVAQGVARKVSGLPPGEFILVDAVRIPKQVEELRSTFGEDFLHVHLTAGEEELQRRYTNRAPHLKEFATYAEAKANGTEQAIDSLRAIANLTFDTERVRAEAIVSQVSMNLGYYSGDVRRLVDVVVGAQFGSEGKGNICAHLAHQYQVLMRVGGPNAGHKVAHPPYKYIQLPSGTLSNPEAKILVGAGATIWVPIILKEAMELKLGPDRLAIDPNAVIINQGDRDYEESLEAIGSTKQGVGAVTARKVLGRDGMRHLGSRVQLAKDVPELRPFIRDTKFELERAYAAGKRVMLEGTQGTDLSLHHGPYPHVTSRETTASGCLADAGIGPRRVRKVIMVARTYPIRVGGTSGDIPSETTFQTISDASGIPLDEITTTEVGSVSGKRRRIGEFSIEQIQRSAELNTATDIALTFADYLSVKNQSAQRYEDLTEETKEFIERIERVVGVPVSWISKAFNATSIIEGKSR